MRQWPVEPRSELLVRSSHSRVRSLLVASPVFAVACSATLAHSLVSVHLASEHLGEGAGWCTLPSAAVHVSVPFHAAGVRFVGCLLSPLVGFLVAFNPAVAGAPSYFDPDPWLLAVEFGDVVSCRDDVSLSWARVV